MTESSYILNFGPHHPSTHGVLRLILELQGEKILRCEPKIGYLHRGIEKLLEKTKYQSVLPYVDRLDYLSPLIQEHCWCLLLEKLLSITIPKRAILIRGIFDELTRISSHIMGIGSATYDLGCLSLFLYGFEEREKIMDIFQSTTGGRVHHSYYSIGGVSKDITNDSIDKIKTFTNKIHVYLNYVEKLALNSRIFKKRTEGIGIISSSKAIDWGITGINARASGISFDIRKNFPYGIYNISELNFSPLTLTTGDVFSRTLLRFLEIKQSVEIIKSCMEILEPGKSNSFAYSEQIRQNSIEEVLHNAFFAHGPNIPNNQKIYQSVENPRGEFGIFLITNEKNTPSRIHFKSPSFSHIQLLKTLLPKNKIADIPAILGSLDFIMGDCDR